MIKLAESKGEILTSLFDARMQHTLWVSEVKNNQQPNVQADHTLCDFGQWLIMNKDMLGVIPAFLELHEPHRKLHIAYQTFLKASQNDTLRENVIAQSVELISKIDALEHVIQQDVQ